jgi:hypothetical protein
MAEMITKRRRRRKRGHVSAFFRSLYEDPAHLLATPNADLIEQWLKNFPSTSEKALRKVKANLANLKSVMRKQHRKGRKGKTSAPAMTPSPVYARSGNRSLEALEESIDDCLTLAKNIDRQGLESVIKRLRLARNEVVWKIDH